jgi:hypothetical protein
MAKYEHTITFVTEIDDSHSVAPRAAALTDEQRTEMFNGGLINLFINKELERINADGSWATVSIK